jgi:LL-diaminopimelate aminotransferase
MPQLSQNFSHLNHRYLFAFIAEKTKDYDPKKLINLGIGDIARPLLDEIAESICKAANEMTHLESLKGYGPETGYSFLKQAILKDEYEQFGFDESEIFITEGINPELTVFQELFMKNSKIALQDPSYPAYYDTNIIAGNISKDNPCIYLPCLEENQFNPEFPAMVPDLIYLCSPNNPTGAAMNRSALKKWVDYAQTNHCLILFDGAYAAFIQSSDIPKSIYEIEGAENVAIEFRSFSKSAGFTGLRCGYTIVPKTVLVEGVSINPHWMQYKTIRSNGVAYPIQKAALKTFDKPVKQKLMTQIKSYLFQTESLKSMLKELGLTCYGGTDAPFIFLKVPNGMNSWDFFDYLLAEYGIISVPGSGFGKNGEGFVRLSGLITESTFERAKKQFSTLVNHGFL